MPVRLNHLSTGKWELTLGNNEPFLCRAAETQNSSFSSAEYMEGVWPEMVKGNINTVLGAIAWEDIEPEEGEFDFKLVDDILRGAHEHGLKIILLWFGSHKNGHMSYTPSWVKTQPHRFPRCETRPSGDLVTNDWLSVFANESAQADARAFAALMSHLKATDRTETVLMVQVENEPGVLGDTRDRSPLAEQAWNANVPANLLETLDRHRDTLNRYITRFFPTLKDSSTPTNCSWADTFGDSPEAHELFMAYHYALYIETVAAAGKAAYNLPLYTNAALRSTRHTILDGTGGGSKPGIYPCGGPVDTVVDIYQLFAPSLDILSPDIYFADYETMCQDYTHRDRPLFIPEQRRDGPGAIRIWLAIGQYCALGAAPFGIDTLPLDGSEFQWHYELLRQITQPLLQARRDGRDIVGFFFDEDTTLQTDPTKPKVYTMGAWQLRVERQGVYGKHAPGYGLIIATSDNTFLLVGEGYQVTFTSTVRGAKMTGILHVLEKRVVDEKSGRMVTVRKMNGDETHCGKQAVMPSRNPDNGWYPIPTNIPSVTRIAECTVYYI